MLAVSSLHDFDVLRVLSGADYLRVFEADRLAALARLSMGAHSAAYIVGLLFFGIGSTVFGYLWLKSNYIPKALAALGVFASLVVAAYASTFVIFPNFARMVALGCFAPIFLFELSMGFWLLLRGIRPPRASEVR